MRTHRFSISTYWLIAGVLLAAFGGIPLLAGDFATTTQTRAVAKLTAGALILLYGLWLRAREQQAIADGTAAPQDEL